MPNLQPRRELRKQFDHQNGLCCWCLEPMALLWRKPGRDADPLCATWEHITPRSRGGGHELSNLVLAHKVCNSRRQNKIAIPHFRPYTQETKMAFRDELQQLINRYSKENGSNTPDFLIADYLIQCLQALDVAVKARDKWHDNGDGTHTVRVEMREGPQEISAQ